ncbi:MAG: DUF930 domain-containing protein [Pseudorhodoplanes sp.]
MKRSLAVLLLTTLPAQAQTRDDSFLEKLEDTTRLEQVCSLEAMTRVKRDKNPYRPDRAVIHAMAEPKRNGDTLTGEGGAFRSKRKWYQFSFVCKAEPGHMKVTEFTYKLGDEIPEDKWEEFGLYQ